MPKKRIGKKRIECSLWKGSGWSVKGGEIVRGEAGGRVAGDHLFKVLGEKIPFQAISAVEKYLRRDSEAVPNGIYCAHDSMGCPRYIGRGNIFGRLRERKKEYPRELVYFSFYVVENRRHEREIETLLIRSASYLAVFNERKTRASIEPGNLLDYEVGTEFVERQWTKGKRRRWDGAR